MPGIVLSMALLALPARAAAPSALEEYLSAMDEFSSGSERGSLEGLFREAQAAGREMGSRMEGLSAGRLRSLRGRVHGLLLLDSAIYAVAIDAKFWVALADRRGTEADRAFFALYWRTRPDSLRPDYARIFSEQRACLDFGSGRMVSLYRDWGQWRARFPGAYDAEAAAQEAAIAKDLLEGTCACGDEESVAAEYDWFLRALPRSKLAGRAAARLKALREGTSGIRFRCVSG